MKTRRDFLKTSLLASMAAPHLLATSAPPERPLRVAGIGIGGMGRHNLGNLSGATIVALCDVDHVFAALTELTHLGNLAIKLGGRIDWDSRAGRALNRPEADALIRRPRRHQWSLD